MKKRWGIFKCRIGVHYQSLVSSNEVMITGGTLVKSLKGVKASNLNGTRAIKNNWKCQRCGHAHSTIHIPGISKGIKA